MHLCWCERMENLLLICLLLPIFCALLQIIFNKFNFSFYSSLVASVIILISSVLLLKYFFQGGVEFLYVFGDFPAKYGIELLINKYNAIVLFLFSCTLFISVIYSFSEMQELHKRRSVSLVFALQNLAFVGFAGMILTNDLFNLYVFLEIASLASYALIAINEGKNELNSLKTSFDYLIIGSVAATFYLIGVAFLYGFFGTLNIGQMIELLHQNQFDKSILIGALFILLGFLIKCGALPFHFWLINVYRNSMPSITLFLSGISSKAAVFVLIKYFLMVFNLPDFANLYHILQIFALVTIVFGAILALWSDDLLSMIAFSTVSQIGYILLAISLVFSSQIVLTIAMLQFINHSLSKSLLFALALQNNKNCENENADIVEFCASKTDECKNGNCTIWQKCSFFFRISILLIALSNLFGVPFFAGFAYKFLLLSELTNNLLLLTLLLTGSFFSFLYNKKIFVTVYAQLKNLQVMRCCHVAVLVFLLFLILLLNFELNFGTEYIR